MKRIKLRDRILPDYTVGEEIFNSVSHILGGVFAVFALVSCIIKSAQKGSAVSVVSSAVYGGMMILLYTVSGVYHGLKPPTAKKIMQVIDHCTIYFFIGATYTPITLCAISKTSKAFGYGIFLSVWLIAAFATAFTAIDLKKYAKLSMICYIFMGWCVIVAIKPVLDSVSLNGCLLLLGGGLLYTVGAVLFCIGAKRRYFHSVFHIFVVMGSILHYLCIYNYVI